MLFSCPTYIRRSIRRTNPFSPRFFFLQLELLLLRQVMHVLSFRYIDKFARAGMLCLELNRIPVTSARSQTWENNSLGAKRQAIEELCPRRCPAPPASPHPCIMLGGPAGSHKGWSREEVCRREDPGAIASKCLDEDLPGALERLARQAGCGHGDPPQTRPPANSRPRPSAC